MEILDLISSQFDFLYCEKSKSRQGLNGLQVSIYDMDIFYDRDRNGPCVARAYLIFQQLKSGIISVSSGLFSDYLSDFLINYNAHELYRRIFSSFKPQFNEFKKFNATLVVEDPEFCDHLNGCVRQLFVVSSIILKRQQEAERQFMEIGLCR